MEVNLATAFRASRPPQGDGQETSPPKERSPQT